MRRVKVPIGVTMRKICHKKINERCVLNSSALTLSKRGMIKVECLECGKIVIRQFTDIYR